MTETRPCTCAPDERPYPCQHQYALGLCRKAEIRSLRSELANERLKAERLQAVLDARPALNAGLYEAYVRWSAQVGEMESLRAMCTEN